MSNTQVGVIYQQIIADVIESSRVDFEEGGVDDSVLEALRKGWQAKLTQLDVAVFPWDPRPEPTSSLSNPSASSNGGTYQHAGNQAISQQPLQQVGISNANGPLIKSEPGLENPSIPQYGNQISNLPPTTTTAQQRAAAHLHNNYGPRAAASISAIQQGASHGQQGTPMLQQIQMMQQQQQQQQQLQMQLHQQQSAQQNKSVINQGVNHVAQQIPYQEYQKKHISGGDQAITNLQTSRQNNSQADIGNNQIDGTSEAYETSVIIKSSRALNYNANTTCRSEVDNLIRQKVEAMGTLIEGGGLMLPLHKATTTKKKHRVKKCAKIGVIGAQIDGGDEEDDIKYEEFDEDAINSDLDDPDEGLNDEDEDEDGMGHIMLCMYDKVQRVKNKWKCVMKDGVLTVNNKEYVFHKASGEYEW